LPHVAQGWTWIDCKEQYSSPPQWYSQLFTPQWMLLFAFFSHFKASASHLFVQTTAGGRGSRPQPLLLFPAGGTVLWNRSLAA